MRFTVDDDKFQFVKGTTSYALAIVWILRTNRNIRRSENISFKDQDSLTFEIPCSIRLGKAQMLKGGLSDLRNKTLLKMFNMIGIGERAGSGVPDIYKVWDDEGWEAPVVKEEFGNDRTTLVLSFRKKQAVKTDDKKRTIKTDDKKPSIKNRR